MGLPIEYLKNASPKSLANRERVGQRRLQVARATHVGRTLSELDREERESLRCWRACAVLEPGERAEAYAKLAKVIDGLRDRRRILLGEPLPGSRRAGTERRPVLNMVIDSEPIPLLEYNQSGIVQQCDAPTDDAAPTPTPQPTPEG
jgi:hypothetical protein